MHQTKSSRKSDVNIVVKFLMKNILRITSQILSYVETNVEIISIKRKNETATL